MPDDPATPRFPIRPSARSGPQPVLPSRRGWPLHGVAASRRAERDALAAAAPHALMARAGDAVARLALAVAPRATRVVAVAGPGNNGGDAAVAAARLHGWGRAVRLVAVGFDPADGDALARLPDDARDAWSRARAAGVPIAAGPAALEALGAGDAVLDGLLGLGARRAAAGGVAEAIEAIRTAARRGAPVVAIDVPSGLDADRGTVFGAQAVVAAHTLALLTLKPGLFTAHGRDHAGRVWLDDLGVAPDAAGRGDATLLGPPPARSRRHAQHKGSFGDAIVVGGAPGMAGAAWLAARAALTAGAGRVFVGLLGRVDVPGAGAGSPGDDALGAPAPAFDPQRPELMVRAAAALLDASTLARSTVVAGCGGGAAIAAVLPTLLAHAARLVVDADALNAVAADPALAAQLAARASRGQATVLTPHPLEAARLLGRHTDAAAVQADRLGTARTLASRFAAVVVLKGSGTVVARPDGRVAVNPTGSARLGTAGTGDVLAGWIGGAWAAGGDARWAAGSGPDDVEGDAAHDLDAAANVAEAAVWRHGAAADGADPAGGEPPAGPMLAADLIDAMRRLS